MAEYRNICRNLTEATINFVARKRMRIWKSSNSCQWIKCSHSSENSKARQWKAPSRESSNTPVEVICTGKIMSMGGHCRPWCQGAQGLSEHHFHDSPGLRSLLRYTEMQVHIVCATKNILKTPKNIRRYDFYSYLCIRKIIFARLLT